MPVMVWFFWASCANVDIWEMFLAVAVKFLGGNKTKEIEDGQK